MIVVNDAIFKRRYWAHLVFRRRQVVELPGPRSLLRTHDRLVAIGPREGIERLQRARKVEAEEPKI